MRRLRKSICEWTQPPTVVQTSILCGAKKTVILEQKANVFYRTIRVGVAFSLVKLEIANDKGTEQKSIFYDISLIMVLLFRTFLVMTNENARKGEGNSVLFSLLVSAHHI